MNFDAGLSAGRHDTHSSLAFEAPKLPIRFCLGASCMIGENCLRTRDRAGANDDQAFASIRPIDKDMIQERGHVPAECLVLLRLGSPDSGQSSSGRSDDDNRRENAAQRLG
jgi:hypothetical protein